MFQSLRSIFGYVWENVTLWVYLVAFVGVFCVLGQPVSALGQPKGNLKLLKNMILVIFLNSEVLLALVVILVK